LASLSVFLFIFKSIFSLYFNKRILRFLSNKSAEISFRLFRSFTSKSLLFVQAKSSQEVITALNVGVTNSILGILGSASIFLSEIGLLALITIVLIMVNPLLTVFAILYFMLIILMLQKVVSKIGLEAGKIKTETDINSAEVIQETIMAFREIFIMNRLYFVQLKFEEIRKLGSRAIADYQLISLFPKYIMESSLILGAGLLSMYQLVNGSSANALAGLVVFLAAGSRLLPSLLRIQNSASVIQNAIGSVSRTFDLIDRIDLFDMRHTVDDAYRNHQNFMGRNQNLKEFFEARITLEAITFSYPGQKTATINNVSLILEPGDSLAIVGSSGAGKSTLTDLILGLLVPQSGRILINGLSPLEAIERWPESIGYVPQTIGIFDTSIRENIAICRKPADINDVLVWEALEKANLSHFVSHLPQGLNSRIGERGVALSGGQRQRLGLARALYSQPKFLILDEATSALDAETENTITSALNNLSDDTTTITIAHRLGTIRNADMAIYIDKGRIIAQGSFEQIRKSVPQLDTQAKFLGL
jgi:ABC-type multidrug transport system fused ATPase/permease subunit